MKLLLNIISICLINLFFVFDSNAQLTIQDIGAFESIDSKDWTFNWVNYTPQKVEYPEADFELSGTITEDLTLYNTQTYLIKGNVYIESGVSVRIFPGTVLRGDTETKGTLIVKKGGQLIAQGTSSDPVIFTSNKSVGGRDAGDWGGIIMLGESNVNRIGGLSKLEGSFDHTQMIFGGTDLDDNSGVLKYVRIEFAGLKSDSKTEFGALTLAGVGRSTQIDYVQVSNSAHDGFSFIGGTITPDYLVSHFNYDDDYEFSAGYEGYLKNCLAIRHPLISDFSGSSAFAISGYDKKEEYDSEKKTTNVIIASSTMVKIPSTGLSNPATAVVIGNEANVKIEKSILLGFDNGLEFLEPGVLRRIQNNQIEIVDSYISVSKSKFLVGDNESVVSDWYSASKFHNVISHSTDKSSLSVFNNATGKGRFDLRLNPEIAKGVVGF